MCETYAANNAQRKEHRRSGGGASPCTRSAVRCLSMRTRRLTLLLAFREGVLGAALAWDTSRPAFGQNHPMEEQVIHHPAARSDSGRP